jgi:hypothetical protein
MLRPEGIRPQTFLTVVNDAGHIQLRIQKPEVRSQKKGKYKTFAADYSGF